MKLTCPGKIFITGEYACIEGGPALLATLEPVFTLDISSGSDAGGQVPFPSESPAARYLEKQNVRGALQWHDPYTSAIGVGSSSAQFLLSVTAAEVSAGRTAPSPEDILTRYWNTVGYSQGLRPSGVDVVAQLTGGPVVVVNEPFATRKLEPWKGQAQFLLAYTGHKLRTHEHLRELKNAGFPAVFASTLEALNAITLRAITAWETSDALALGRALNDYQLCLQDGGLSTGEFGRELEGLRRFEGVLGCKGSGAQGGDCALILAEASRAGAIAKEINRRGWAPIEPVWTSHGLRLIS